MNASKPALPSVFLIGGSSSVGKTTVTREITKATGAHHVHLKGDWAGAPILDPATGGPFVFEWDPGRPALELCDLLIRAAEAYAPAILGRLDGWRLEHGAIVVEGERIHPSVVERVRREGIGDGVFIVEESAERLHETLMMRSESFRALRQEVRRNVAEVGRLYGEWVRRECEARGVRWVWSRPWGDVVDRLSA